MANVVTISQSVEIDGIADVAVSAIAHDDVAGDYFRDIVLFGDAGEGQSTMPAVLSVRMRAATADPLKITVPQDSF